MSIQTTKNVTKWEVFQRAKLNQISPTHAMCSCFVTIASLLVVGLNICWRHDYSLGFGNMSLREIWSTAHACFVAQ